MGIVAIVSQYPRNPRGGELLYTCRETMSEFEFFMYFMDEIVTGKNLRIVLNSRSDLRRCCLFCSFSYW